MYLYHLKRLKHELTYRDTTCQMMFNTKLDDHDQWTMLVSVHRRNEQRATNLKADASDVINNRSGLWQLLNLVGARVSAAAGMLINSKMSRRRHKQ